MKRNNFVKLASYDAGYPTRARFKAEPRPEPERSKPKPPKLFGLFTMFFALVMAWFFSSCHVNDDKKIEIGPDQEIKEGAPNDWETTLGVDHPDVEIKDGDIEPEYDEELDVTEGIEQPYDYPEPEYDKELDVTEGGEQPYDYPEPDPEYYDEGLETTIGEEAPYDVPDYADDAIDDYQITEGEGLPYDYVEDAAIDQPTDNLTDINNDNYEGGWQDTGTGTPILPLK